MRKIILLAVAMFSATATVSAQESDGALLVIRDALRWLAPGITCLESTPLERCPPSPAVVPFADEQWTYDLQELCGNVFYERLVRTGVQDELTVVWTGDPAASFCALLDTGTEALYLPIDDLTGTSLPRLPPGTTTSAGLEFSDAGPRAGTLSALTGRTVPPLRGSAGGGPTRRTHDSYFDAGDGQRAGNASR